ncbi:RNA polymerase sigma-70 factor, ECF subfamily [Streptomyces sp. yr375]|uniref:RNA polymerase sigma factor n=1 Tax=Streptomyces sp. yr375 TaxID=1761906 RepID=UPI0008BA11BA|nr:RNA polymerase sigma factor [Streptomyces sp. yr375]SEQ90186.1 RNA polymerase sigma-70 factor, ECF subfamily [Streptomyces sp. yr375]
MSSTLMSSAVTSSAVTSGTVPPESDVVALRDRQVPEVSVLLPRAQAGDRQAMNDLLQHVAPLVVRLCQRVTRRHGPDAAQEAMVAIYRGLRGLREPGAFYAWVRAVAVREAVRTHQRLGDFAAEDLPDLVQDANPMAAVHISDVLDRLPDHHREVLTLRVVYGLDEQEMATALALPLGTVRSRLYRARRNFHDAWHQQPA